MLQPSNEYNCSGSVTLNGGDESGEQEVLIREVTVNTLVDRWDKKQLLLCFSSSPCVKSLSDLTTVFSRPGPVFGVEAVEASVGGFLVTWYPGSKEVGDCISPGLVSQLSVI